MLAAVLAAGIAPRFEGGEQAFFNLGDINDVLKEWDRIQKESGK